MAEVSKVMYIVVVDDEDEEGNYRKKKKIEKMSVENESFRYTRPILQSTLQLMGCKPRHAFKISKRVFGTMTSQSSKDVGLGRFVPSSSLQHTEQELVMTNECLVQPETDASFIQTKEQESAKNSSELYRRRTTVVLSRDKFLDVVCDALAEYKYVGPKQRGDLFLACRIRERKESVTVLLCGTSGCGKSALSSLLASRLGITTVVSTDSIRHMMRSFVDEQQNPLLWASTYHARECLDPNAVADANIRRKARKKVGVSHSFSKEKLSECIWNEKCQSLQQETVPSNTEQISEKQMAVEGFKAQSEMVIESLDRLITSWEERKESVIVEGVHLSLNFVMGLMKRHPSIIPFMIYITNEDKHLERFAVRAKYMTLDPARNKYVKYIKNIRRIQEYLCKRADKHLVPKINNTNVDKSVATIHATVFSSLRRCIAGEQLYDPTTNRVTAIYDEYRNQCAADSWSSKGMFRLLHGKGAPRHLMAFVNADGSIARAWPITPTDRIGMPSKPALGHESDSMIGTTISGFLQNGKAEPVNLHFGHFGVSAWPRDTGGSSRAGSVDESRTDLTNTETGSRCFSSCCSSPHMSDRPTKGHMAEVSVLGSDDEVDDQPEPGSEEDFSDGHKHYPEEMEGSIDEESTKSNEEYDDLAMQDDQEDGYWHDEDKDLRQALSAFLTNSKEECNISPTLDMFLRTQRVPVCQQMA